MQRPSCVAIRVRHGQERDVFRLLLKGTELLPEPSGLADGLLAGERRGTERCAKGASHLLSVPDSERSRNDGFRPLVVETICKPSAGFWYS